MSKVCIECGIEKELSEYQKAKTNKDGLTGKCKACLKKYNQQYCKDNEEFKKQYRKERYEENKERFKKETRDYYYNNIEKVLESTKEYREKNKEEINTYRTRYYQNNSEQIKEKNKQRYVDNREEYCRKRAIYREENIESIRQYYYDNKKEINSKKNEYDKQRRKTDPMFRLKVNLRGRIGDVIKKKKYSLSTLDILGCSYEEVRIHIENKFTEGMCWEKVGPEIHIDHIIPLDSAKNEEDLIMLCYYTNLQPMWAKENLSKGNKIIINE